MSEIARVGTTEIAWDPGLSIYASPPFLRTLSNEYGYLAGFDDAGQRLCILPYVVLRRNVLRMVRFPMAPQPIGGELDVESERSFLNGVVDHFRSCRVDVIIPATHNAIFRTYPIGAIAAPYGTYRLDLAAPEEELWRGIHAKHKNKIRRAMKAGVEIRDGKNHVEEAYSLIRESFRRSNSRVIRSMFTGFRLSRQGFQEQVRSFGDNVRVFLAVQAGRVQGCAIIPFSQPCAYYMHGGTIAGPATGAMNLLQWEAIRNFRASGVRHYDFVGARIHPEPGSKQEGINHFKSRFGGTLVQGYMWKLPINRWKYRLYRVAAALRSGGDLVDKEHHKLADFDLEVHRESTPGVLNAR